MDQWIRDLYKSKGGFGMTLESRRNASLDIRKDHRNSLLKTLRNIPENMSPLKSPMPPKGKIQNTHATTTKSENSTANTTNRTEKTTNKRLEQLKKWKQERDRRKLEEKKKAKPVFKVFHVEHKDHFESIFVNATGKPSRTAQAPVKPNGMNEVKPGKTITRSNKNSDNKLVKTPPSRSRSQTTKIFKPPGNTTSNNKSEVSNKTDCEGNWKKSTKGAEIPPEKSTEVNKGKQQKKTTESSENIDIVKPKLNNDNTTTHKENNDPSPDTTAGNEDKCGSISGSGTDPRSPKAAADYFTRKLEDEIERIQAMCRTWQNYKDEADLSEAACGLINMTIGHSNLLMTNKFNQFRGLIEKCQAKEELEMTIKCEDLHGFWDMMYKQVTDLDKRFGNLEYMKKKNLLEKVPKIKTPKAVLAKASSLLKETILAARKNRLNVKSEGEIEILITKPNKTPKRKSRSQKGLSTSMRGILNSGSVKTDKRKTVIFQNFRDSMDEDSSNLHVKGTPIPSRRSQRILLKRSKLTYEE